MRTDMQSVSCVTILMAMQAEADPLIERLGLQLAQAPFAKSMPMAFYQGSRSEIKIALITSGIDSQHGVDLIGPVPATLSASLACDHTESDIIFSAGTAGGFAAKGAAIGSVYVSDEKAIFHDREVPLPGFDESGLGHFPVLNVRRMARDLGFGVGVISSGSSFLREQRQLDVMHRHNAVAKEMEAAAIAWVCSLYQQPFVAVKSITNLLDKPDTSEQQFTENLAYASETLAAAMAAIIDYCVGKNAGDLCG